MDKRELIHPLLVSKDALNELQNQGKKFEQSCGKLVSRDSELVEMIASALRRKDNLRANMYANELVRVRHMKQVFSQSQLALECISIRMESLLDFYQAIQIDPVSEAIRDVVSDIQGISPEFTANLEKLTSTVRETLSQATIGFKEPALDEAFSANSPESIAILREVSKTIESSLHEAFPEPPIVMAPTRVPQVAEEISYGGEATFIPSRTAVRNAGGIDELSDDVFKILNSRVRSGEKED